MGKPTEQKPVKKESLSPASYEPINSFKKTQTGSLNGYIGKYKINNFVSEIVKANSWKVAPGIHDIDKSKNIVTKGLSKGWK